MNAATRPMCRPSTNAVPESQTGDWRHSSLCRGEDPELFFPVGDTPSAQQQTEAAKAVCGTCPVMAQCAQWALESRQDTGVWGGMSEKDRRRIHRRRIRVYEYERGDIPAWKHMLDNRLGEYRGLQEKGLRPAQIAKAMGTNVQTLYTVDRALEQRAERAAAEEQAVAA